MEAALNWLLLSIFRSEKKLSAFFQFCNCFRLSKLHFSLDSATSTSLVSFGHKSILRYPKKLRWCEKFYNGNTYNSNCHQVKRTWHQVLFKNLVWAIDRLVLFKLQVKTMDKLIPLSVFFNFLINVTSKFVFKGLHYKFEFRNWKYMYEEI